MIDSNIDMAFKFLVKTFSEKIVCYCYKVIGSKEDAEDLTQEIYLKTYISLKNKKDIRNYEKWIFRIAHNECMNFLKKKRIKTIPFNEDYTFCISSSNNNVSAEDIEYIEYILKSLNSKERSLLILRCKDNFKYFDIAYILGIKENAVKKRMERLRKKIKNLKNRYERVGFYERATKTEVNS